MTVITCLPGVNGQATEDSDDDSDVDNVLRVPSLVHSKEGSASSATSSVFTDVLRTPKMSEFSFPSTSPPSATKQTQSVIKVETVPELYGIGETNIASPVEYVS